MVRDLRSGLKGMRSACIDNDHKADNLINPCIHNNGAVAPQLLPLLDALNPWSLCVGLEAERGIGVRTHSIT